MLIEQLTQKDEKSCMCCSMAIILGVREEDIFDDFHKRYRQGGLVVSDWFDEKNITNYTRHYSDERTFEFGRVYLCSVPSLNMPKGSHALVVWLPSDDDIDFVVIDPNKGKNDKMYYVASESECALKGAALLTSFIPIVSFSEDDLESVRVKFKNMLRGHNG